MERKLSGQFWSMSGFTTGFLLLICFSSEETGRLFPAVLFWRQLKGYFSGMKYCNFFFIEPLQNLLSSSSFTRLTLKNVFLVRCMLYAFFPPVIKISRLLFNILETNICTIWWLQNTFNRNHQGLRKSKSVHRILNI